MDSTNFVAIKEKGGKDQVFVDVENDDYNKREVSKDISHMIMYGTWTMIRTTWILLIK